MKTNKPNVFISHITEESFVAKELRSLIIKKFLGTLDVFVSSHEDSIRMGDDWFSTIRNSIEQCVAVIVICSPISVTRPWINFEAGAGWVRGIPVIPLCHSGVTPGRLPIPLSTLQGGMVNNPKDVEILFGRIASILGMNPPDSQDASFFDSIRSFESDARINRLYKDTAFVHAILNQDVVMLAYLMYATVTDLENLSKIDVADELAPVFTAKFNEFHRMFNPVLIFSLEGSKVYQSLASIIGKLSDSIKFIISSPRVELAPELDALLRNFMVSINSDWVRAIDVFSAKSPRLQEMYVEMIKAEPDPPQRKISNAINPLIDYYETVVQLRSWVVNYHQAIARLLPSPLATR